MRILLLCLSMLALLGCTTGRDLDAPPAPLGDFKLGHSIVIAPNLTKGPLSRDATDEEWIAAVDKAFEDRFRRYDGERFYHFGISVEGYVLARVGVPLVLQPKSLLVYRITVWDDEAQTKMNHEAHEVTVIEAVTADTVAGSGLTQTREEQLENLAILAAKQAEEWLVKQHRSEKWFRGFDVETAKAEAEAKAAAVAEKEAARAERKRLREERAAARKAKAAGEAPETVVETVKEVASEADTVAEELLVEEPLEAVEDPEVVPFSDS